MQLDWYKKHMHSSTLGDRIADRVASFIGSWKFIILQSIGMSLWILGNVLFYVFHFDPYPFVFLNLFMSAEAAFSTPLIMMSQNRSANRDRHQAEADYQTNIEAKVEIEQLIQKLDTIEIEKLDKILALLSK